jgi:hypothetical protein
MAHMACLAVFHMHARCCNLGVITLDVGFLGSHDNSCTVSSYPAAYFEAPLTSDVRSTVPTGKPTRSLCALDYLFVPIMCFCCPKNSSLCLEEIDGLVVKPGDIDSAAEEGGCRTPEVKGETAPNREGLIKQAKQWQDAGVQARHSSYDNGQMTRGLPFTTAIIEALVRLLSQLHNQACLAPAALASANLLTSYKSHINAFHS